MERTLDLIRHRSVPEVPGRDQPADEHVEKGSQQPKVKWRIRRDRNTPAGRMIFENNAPKIPNN